MKFKNRKAAANQLAKELSGFRDDPSIYLLGISNGGVKTGSYTARQLQLPFWSLMIEHLHFPDNSNAVFGAVTEKDTVFYISQGYRALQPAVLNDIIATKEAIIEKKIKKYRSNKSLPSLQEKTVLLIDDGISTGAKMHAAVCYSQKEEARKIIVATPMAGSWIIGELKKEVNEIIVLEPIPHYFSAIESHEYYSKVNDEAMGKIIKKWERARPQPKGV